MTFRRFLFWCHLATGVTVGLVILNSALSGMLLAFEPQIVSWMERDVRRVVPPSSEAKRLSIDALLAKARQAQPDARPNGITVRSDPAASVSVNFGREGGTWYLNPYTGDVLGHDSKTHDLMHKIEDWHRGLWKKEIGEHITGAACLAFFFMLCSGIYLWWPRKVMRFNPRLQGRDKDWNWHNVIGSWFSPLILITTLTGTILAYRWAGNLLFTLTGSESPFAQQKGQRLAQSSKPEGMRDVSKAPALDLETLWAQADQQAPGWVSITLRQPRSPGDSATASIEERGWLGLKPRREFNSKPNLGKKLRSWIVPIHTGRAMGLLGQSLAFLSACGVVLLIWTGLSMAWRRFFAKRLTS